jgi:hypothetical protein
MTDCAASPGPDGLIRIWLDRKVVERLRQMRGPGESYSDVILWLAKTSSYKDAWRKRHAAAKDFV